jgi:hypothetical protein
MHGDQNLIHGRENWIICGRNRIRGGERVIHGRVHWIRSGHNPIHFPAKEVQALAD